MKLKIEIDDKNIEILIQMIRDAVVSAMNPEETTKQETPLSNPGQVHKEKPETKAKEYTFTEVRTLLTEKSREGYTDQVKALVGRYSDEGKLSKVKQENYADLVLEAQFVCRPPFTREEVAKRIEELKTEGYSDELPGLLDHHYATSAEDLKEEYFASFMRDAWRLDRAGN